jgi:hypothetical protein
MVAIDFLYILSTCWYKCILSETYIQVIYKEYDHIY